MNDNKYGSGYIYLLRRHDGWHRVGRTAHPKNRFSQWRWLAKINNYNLTPLLLIQVRNQRWAELVIHSIFDGKRTNQRHRGMGSYHEWFKLDKDDLWTFLYWARTASKRIHPLNGRWELPDEVQ